MCYKINNKTWGERSLTPLEEKRLRWIVMSCTEFSELNEATVNIYSYPAFLKCETEVQRG